LKGLAARDCVLPTRKECSEENGSVFSANIQEQRSTFTLSSESSPLDFLLATLQRDLPFLLPTVDGRETKAKRLYFKGILLGVLCGEK